MNMGISPTTEGIRNSFIFVRLKMGYGKKTRGIGKMMMNQWIQRSIDVFTPHRILSKDE